MDRLSDAGSIPARSIQTSGSRRILLLRGVFPKKFIFLVTGRMIRDILSFGEELAVIHSSGGFGTVIFILYGSIAQLG